MSGSKAVDLVVSGRVQGVFYRSSMRREADRLGVRGWVANRDNGTVEAHVEGDPRAVDELVRWCRTGPPHAQVEGVDTAVADVNGAASFED